MHCDNKDHIHFTDEQMERLIAEYLKKHSSIMSKIQQTMLDKKVCTNEFFTLLINCVVIMTSEAILYVSTQSDMTKDAAVDMIIGGIAKRSGVEYKVNLEKSPGNANRHAGTAVH